MPREFTNQPPMILITSISQFSSYLIICTLLEKIMYHSNTGIFNWIYGPLFSASPNTFVENVCQVKALSLEYSLGLHKILNGY